MAVARSGGAMSGAPSGGGIGATRAGLGRMSCSHCGIGGGGARAAAGLGRRSSRGGGIGAAGAAGGWWRGEQAPLLALRLPLHSVGPRGRFVAPFLFPTSNPRSPIIARFLDLAEAASVGAFVAWAPPPLPIHQVQLQLMLPLIDRGMHRGGFPASVTCFSDPYALELVVFLDRLLLP